MSGDGKRTEVVSTKVTQQLVDDLTRVAAADDRSVSDYLNLLLRRELYGRIAALDAAEAPPIKFFRGAPLTAGERAAVYVLSAGTCAYCKAPITTFDFEVDHVVPVAKGGTRDPGNLVASCKACNRSKRVRDADEFLASKSA